MLQPVHAPERQRGGACLLPDGELDRMRKQNDLVHVRADLLPEAVRQDLVGLRAQPRDNVHRQQDAVGVVDRRVADSHAAEDGDGFH